MAEWIDLRCPPKSLIRQTKSSDYEKRNRAADGLGNYAHTQSVDILLTMLGDEHHWVRTSAIESLAAILAYKHLKKRKYEVGRAIVLHLFIGNDSSTASRFIDRFLDDPSVLEQYLLFIQAEIDRTPIPKRDSEYLLNILEKSNVLPEEDLEYVIRKLREIGLFTPGLHHRVISQGLSFLAKAAPRTAFEYAVKHIASVKKDGYPLEAYGNGPKIKFENRAGVRKRAIGIVQSNCVNPENLQSTYANKLIAQAIISLLQISRPKLSKEVCTNGEVAEARHAVWQIIHSDNFHLLSSSSLGGMYKYLFDDMRANIEKKLLNR